MGRIAAAALGAFFLFPLAASAQTAPAPAVAPGQGRGAPPPQENLIMRADPALDRLIAPDARVEILADGFVSTEGPLWRDGRIWVSDQRASKTIAVDASGNKTIIAENSGGVVDPAITVNQGPNAMVAYKDGTVLVCRQGFRDMAVYHKDGSFTPFLSEYDGKRLNSPNDMVFAPDGALWFTDPAFSLPGGMDGPNSVLHFEGVYRYKDGKLTPMITDLTRPNGIGFSPDGKILYISTGSPKSVILAYDVAADGALSNKREFATWPPPAPGTRAGAMDGLKLDSEGNLWATGPGGVNIITPDGRNLGHIQLSGRTASNVAFGGADGRTLFITGGVNVYRVQTLARGETPLYEEK